MSCCGKGSCGSHEQMSCHNHERGYVSGQGESKTAAYFLHQIEEMLEESFDALHEQIEELEDKVERLEKQLARK